MLKVYGHPRSGNNYIMALLALNFYADEDVSTGQGRVGHWANRVWIERNDYGQLAGHHGSPGKGFSSSNGIYVYRDGRAVIASLYKSQHFINHQWRKMDFNQFIREPLDWSFSPGRHVYPGCNIIEHWRDHLKRWRNERIYKVQYEQAVRDPQQVLEFIARHFNLLSKAHYELPDRLVGFFPSGGMLKGWMDLWDEEDTDYFLDVVGDNFWGVVGNTIVRGPHRGRRGWHDSRVS